MAFSDGGRRADQPLPFRRTSRASGAVPSSVAALSAATARSAAPRSCDDCEFMVLSRLRSPCAGRMRGAGESARRMAVNLGWRARPSAYLPIGCTFGTLSALVQSLVPTWYICCAYGSWTRKQLRIWSCVAAVPLLAASATQSQRRRPRQIASNPWLRQVWRPEDVKGKP